MPIYEYQCKKCNHRLEKLQKVTDSPLVDCPACENQELVKLVSAAGFRLKGSGWYETDFKKGSKRNIVEGGSESVSSSGDTDKTGKTGQSSDSGNVSSSSTSDSTASKSASSN